LLASNVEEYERLSRMAESMLFLARAEHANLLPSKTILDTPDELRRIVEYFEGPAEDAGVTLRVTAAGRVNADAILFRRAVGNLVANAIRYTPAGGKIVLSACCTSDATTISVSNPGVGIEKQHLPKIFDRFYRADAARQDSASSAGLGLAIVKSIMSLHGGRAEVDSIPHRMTRFHLIFPNGDIVLPCPD
jgi:two-component system heavy metal sensor histidine kinase CusS